MRLQCFEEISKISRQILEILRKEYSPGERIPAEREWAARLNLSHNRVHRALRKLADEGVLWSSGGRRGLFLVDVAPAVPYSRRHVELQLFLPPELPQNSLMYLNWCKICDMFHVSHPSVTVRITEERAKADVILNWPPLLDTGDLQILHPAEIIPEEELLPRVCCAGELNGIAYAIPVLHSPGCFWGNRNILSRHGCYVSGFRDPADFFRWGNKLNRAKECASGFTFMGFTYHATQWGVDFTRNGNFLEIAPAPLESFLRDIYDLVPVVNMHYTAFNNFKVFHRGQQALVGGYLHDIPIAEYRFVLLGAPLKPNGYANHTAFMLSATKHTRYSGDVFDLIRFCLTEAVQKLFFKPIVHFSVRKELYEEEYRTLSEETGVSIPRFDPRGYFPGLREDLWLAANSFYYQQCAGTLARNIRLELAVQRMRKVNIRELRRCWLLDSPPDVVRQYASYAHVIARESGENDMIGSLASL